MPKSGRPLMPQNAGADTAQAGEYYGLAASLPHLVPA